MISFRRRGEPEPPAPPLPPVIPVAGDYTRIDIAKRLLWETEPTDRALTGWQGWAGPGGGT